MKTFACITLLVFVLFSCTKKSESDSVSIFNPKKYPQKWQLVKMFGMVVNVAPTTGADMSWQEYYVLNSDKTFVKSREIKGTVALAIGTYSFLTLSDGVLYLELKYTSDNDLIGNCTTETKELLRVDKKNKLTGTWWACDGPGLFYERVQ